MQIPVSWDGVCKVLWAARRPLLDRMALTKGSAKETADPSELPKGLQLTPSPDFHYCTDESRRRRSCALGSRPQPERASSAISNSIHVHDSPRLIGEKPNAQRNY